MHLSIVSTVTGKRIHTFAHGGHNFAVIPPTGGGYKLVITAPMGHRRAEAVVSVDGLDVLDGKTASREKRGYVFTGELEILGWRVDKSREAAFVFAETPESYAAQVGQDQGSAGTIGLALYAERYSGDIATVRTKSFGEGVMRGPTRGASLSAAPPEIGTGFGEMIQSPVGETTFKRVACLALEVVHYRTREWLARAGVPIPFGSDDLGNAFPGDTSFCALPPGYRG